MMSALSAKHIRLLERMDKGEVVIARFDHHMLRDLRLRGLVDGQNGRTVAGKLSDQAIWTISRRGTAYLVERAPL